MAKLRIQEPNAGKTAVSKRLLVIVFLLIAGLILWVIFSPGRPLPSFEVSSLSGPVEVFSQSSASWSKPDRGTLVKARDRIRTGPEGEVELQIADAFKMRLKENSEMVYEDGKFYQKKPPVHMYLEQGTLFAAAMKAFADENVRVTTPYLRADSKGASFRVESNRENENTWIGVLSGSVSVKPETGVSGSAVTLKSLHQSQAGKGMKLASPKRVTRDEWLGMQEIYDLTKKSAALEAAQLDLSKFAGSMFDFVFDHGTFYTPKVGYCGREFFQDPATGKSTLEVDYDVFPTGSYVGVYIKTRDLDLSRFSQLQFEMQRAGEEGYPINMRIEVKNKSGIARAFAAKLPQRDWQTVSFPLGVTKPLLVNEIALVFLNDRVGEYKKGKIRLREINLIPKEEAPTAVSM